MPKQKRKATSKVRLDRQTVRDLTDPDPKRFATMALALVEEQLLETVQEQARRYLHVTEGEPQHDNRRAVSLAMKLLLERFAKRAVKLAKKPAKSWHDIAV